MSYLNKKRSWLGVICTNLFFQNRNICLIMQNIDLRLKCPFTMLVSGPSSSGKTTFVSNLLEKKIAAFNKTGGEIYWFYKVKQEVFENSFNIPIQFETQMVTMNWIEENNVSPNSTIVIDDMALEATEDTAKLFSVGSHHYNINIIFLCQNLFTKNQYFRDISLNSTYIVLFKNIRDKLQITNFAKQFAPGKTRAFTDIFQKATRQPYSYLILDNHQRTSEDHRILSNYLQEDNKPIHIWLLKDQ